MLGFIKKSQKFLNEVVIELKKVSWSTRTELIASTIAVILLVLFLFVFIGICDFFLSRAVDLIIRWSR